MLKPTLKSVRSILATILFKSKMDKKFLSINYLLPLVAVQEYPPFQESTPLKIFSPFVTTLMLSTSNKISKIKKM